MSPRRPRLFVAAVLLISAVLARLGTAQCLEWDPGFRARGMNSSVLDSVVFDDGTGPMVYAVGNFFEASGVPARSIARWENGHWAPLPYASGPAPTSTLSAVHVWDDGTGPALYVGGQLWISNQVSYCVAKWTGGIWTGIPNGPDDVVTSIEDFGGSLYVGGTFDHVGSQFQPGIARWTGSAWISMPGFFGGAGITAVHALSVYDDGKGPALYAGGVFENVVTGYVPNIARWDGNAWSSVSVGFNGAVLALTVLDTSSGPALVAAGDFTQADGFPASRVAQWSGGTWSSLGAGIGGRVRALATVDDPQGGGKVLFAAGLFTTAGSASVHNVARWNGSAWSAAGTGTDGEVRDLAVHDLGAGPRILAGGDFEHAGSNLVHRIAAWDGTQWASPEASNAVEGSVSAIAHFDDGHGDALYAGGSFEVAGGSASRAIARYDGASWSSVGNGMSGEVLALCAFDDGHGEQLYAGGNFTLVGAPQVHAIARWDGTHWAALPGTFQAPDTIHFTSLVAHDDGSGMALYAGGATFIPQLAAGGVLRWKDGVWSSVGGFLNGDIRALTVHDDGSGPALYAAGYIALAGPGPITYVAKWNGIAWSQVGGIPTAIQGTHASCILSHDDGTGPALYVGGHFQSMDGSATSNIAAWKNGTWSPLGSGMSGQGNDVLSLAIHDDGSGRGPALYAAGDFASAGGVDARGIARWNGAEWSALDAGASNVQTNTPSVHALSVWDDGTGRDLWLGGYFAFAGAAPSKSFARWHGCGGTGELFCFGDGSGTSCPCGNASTVGSQSGCASSIGQGATLRASGEPSLSSDSLVLHGAGMTSTVALYFQGAGAAANGDGVVFGDGLRCVSGPFVRLGLKTPLAGASIYPAAGDAPISTKGAVLSPGSRTYQARYRNSAAFCTSDTFNLTNGVVILWSH